ncbi:8772_t:CDS:2 [Paraglomus occultum]|uniref:RNA polymerase II transcription factor B subunit 2 n=1 Tax=Paraglomus occultum TaxID=144539 RepID=A0A9N9BKK3_9GLOM|nr:8772_t:CDS:2 [Paraglomus occultum]
MSKLYILMDDHGHMVMNTTFREQFRNALTGGGEHQSFGVPSSSVDRHRPENVVAFLDNHATKQWESILHYMVGTASMQTPKKAVRDLLVRSGLMSLRLDNNELKITNKGFQFLLQDVNTQVWAFLLQYLDYAEVLQMDLVEVLNFFFMLGSLELGQDYSVEQLTDTQKQVVEDLANFGLLYRRKRSSRRYYPTRLATTLTSGTSALLGRHPTPSTVNPVAGEDIATEQGFIILETNYKLYAYTDSPLQIAVLNLFCDLKCRFANMVCGMITRDSIKEALTNGITAEQIISYLNSHAHPQMKKSMPVLPLTVIDQIRLWEMERNRLQASEGHLYEQFRCQADYDNVLRYAQTLGVVLWSNARKCMFVVTEVGHQQVRAFIQKRIAQRKNGATNTLESKTYSI